MASSALVPTGFAKRNHMSASVRPVSSLSSPIPGQRRHAHVGLDRTSSPATARVEEQFAHSPTSAVPVQTPLMGRQDSAVLLVQILRRQGAMVQLQGSVFLESTVLRTSWHNPFQQTISPTAMANEVGWMRKGGGQTSSTDRPNTLINFPFLAVREGGRLKESSTKVPSSVRRHMC